MEKMRTAGKMKEKFLRWSWSLGQEKLLVFIISYLVVRIPYLDEIRDTKYENTVIIVSPSSVRVP